MEYFSPEDRQFMDGAIVQNGLKELGWRCKWIDDVNEAVEETFKVPYC